MFCPRCGTENKEGAKYCVKCGLTLQKLTLQKTTQQKAEMSDKNPAIAAILNFLIIGVGYWYLNLEEVRGIPVWGYIVGGLILGVAEFFLPVLGIPGFIISVLLAIDAYQKAQGEQGFL